MYTYDVGGNIKYVKTYDYTTGELGAVKSTCTYSYDSVWKDKLISYNGQTITYDGAGNPLTYRDGMSFTWEMGRQLASLSTGNKTYAYQYNADGLRIQTSDGTTNTRYTWVDGRLTSQTDGTETLYFRYDENGNPLAVLYNGTEYYYVTNLQGDIIALLDGQGNCVVEYTYDAWGKVLSKTGSMATSLGADNPLRYRGYYYDSETGFYYLQSRYYDPATGRFINADDTTLLGVSGTIVSYNLFAYCDNNPINKKDVDGYIAANVVGAAIGAVIGIVGGIFLGNWLADIIKLSGWKRGLFVGGVAALVGATAAAIGYFIGPYVAKIATKFADYLIQLIQKGKLAISKLSASVRDVFGITKRVVNNLVKNASKLKRSATVMKNVSSRPYINSTQTIQNIMKASKPVVDTSLKNGLKWVVKGSFNGSKGVYELVIDVTTNTIVHFLFKK